MAGICHDFKHDGFTNAYHIANLTKIAIRYNDVSVQENYHLASTFKELQLEQNNFLHQFKTKEQSIFRKRVIECIMNTDMSKHSSL